MDESLVSCRDPTQKLLRMAFQTPHIPSHLSNCIPDSPSAMSYLQ